MVLCFQHIDLSAIFIIDYCAHLEYSCFVGFFLVPGLASEGLVLWPKGFTIENYRKGTFR